LRLYNSQHDSIKHEEEGGKRNLEGFETPFFQMVQMVIIWVLRTASKKQSHHMKQYETIDLLTSDRWHVCELWLAQSFECDWPNKYNKLTGAHTPVVYRSRRTFPQSSWPLAKRQVDLHKFCTLVWWRNVRLSISCMHLRNAQSRALVRNRKTTSVSRCWFDKAENGF